MTTKRISRKIKSVKICSVENCDSKHWGLSFCHLHYYRFKRNGTPDLQEVPTLEERFWSKVDKSNGDNACWIWKASRNEYGYGKIRYNGVLRKATHVVWFLTYGAFPTLDILHSCDNTPCINPKHLREGTQSDNNQDIRDRNRHFSKYSIEQIKECKRLLEVGEKRKDISSKLNINLHTVHAVANGDKWGHI